MSGQYPGGWITRSPPLPDGNTARGMWSLSEQAGYRRQNLWPTVPGAPTIGAASGLTATSASVTFTAPSSAGSAPITQYVVTSSPGGLTGTGASSPITVSGLTTGTAYTFTVTATNAAGTGPASAASNSVIPLVTGQQEYLSAGTYSFVVPAGVTSVSMVSIGGGQGGARNGGAGAGLAYLNNQTVTPGETLTVVVGAGGAGALATSISGSAGSNSSVTRGASALVLARGGASATTQVGTAFFFGGSGGAGALVSGGTFGSVYCTGGGGGAAGYAGNGGAGASVPGSAGAASGANGSGGGGGGGGALRGFVNVGAPNNFTAGYPGNIGNPGGTSVYGQTADGLGTSGSAGFNTLPGGSYGGGGGGSFDVTSAGDGPGGVGGGGAVRIIWPGVYRSFPSTNTGNL